MGEPPGDDVGPHTAELRFSYETTAEATLVADAVSREVGEIEGDRSRADLAREARTVTVTIDADDLVALRAGLNTWGTLLEVAERAIAVAGSSGEDG